MILKLILIYIFDILMTNICLNRHANRHQCYTQADFVSAMDAQRSISLSLILLMLFSTLTLLVGPVDEVSAATAQGLSLVMKYGLEHIL